MVNIKKIIFIIILGVSLALNVALGLFLFKVISADRAQQEARARVAGFNSLFIEKVLMANQDIDFDTRLALETSVKSLNDDDIYTEWQKFTRATNKDDAGYEAKQLLDLLAKKSLQ